MTESLGQWPSAPLVYVLAEVRCSPTLDVGKRAAVIQESIREEFPLLEPITEIQMIAGVPSGTTTSAMFAFTDPSKRRGVVISPTSVCYHVTQYETSKEFFAQLGRVLKAIEPVYSRDTVSRLGLRYVDAIVAKPNETVFDYVSPAFAGLSLDGTNQRRVQCVVEQPRVNGGIAVRFLALGIPLYRSPDLPAPGLRPPVWVERAMERQIPAAVLDTDNWLLDERTFEADSILEKFKGLKEAITDAFLKITTDHATKTWQLVRQDT